MRRRVMAAAALAIYLALRIYQAPGNGRVLALTLVAAAFLLMQWKGAVVRADAGHIARFLIMSLVFVGRNSIKTGSASCITSTTPFRPWSTTASSTRIRPRETGPW